MQLTGDPHKQGHVVGRRDSKHVRQPSAGIQFQEMDHQGLGRAQLFRRLRV